MTPLGQLLPPASSNQNVSKRKHPRRRGVLSINMDSDEAYTHMDDFFHIPHQELLGGGFCPRVHSFVRFVPLVPI